VSLQVSKEETKPTSHFSLVSEVSTAGPNEALRHFNSKLAFETDPTDVLLDLHRGQDSFLLIDARDADSYAACHIPGALSLPLRTINAQTTAHLSKDKVLVTYCWGPACNASTKAAAKLSRLGFHVKEMIGGIEYWRREGAAVEGALGEDAPLFPSILPKA
jgi:rhodanese-related sulfurtransferase